MKNIILGIGIGFIITSFLINAEPNNSSLSESDRDILLEELLKDAAKDYGHPPPEKSDKSYPIMQITSRDFVEWTVCKNAGCNAIASAVDNYVFISDDIDLTTIFGQGIVYHELIHTFQNLQHGEATTCREWVRREEQAYRLQDAWISARGVNNNWIKNRVYETLDEYCLGNYSVPEEN